MLFDKKPESDGKKCVFCDIIARRRAAEIVYEDAAVVCMLDHRPLLHGHCLLMPKTHVETILELPDETIPLLFGALKHLARAIQSALEADGSFLSINTRISQSVPHLHIHIVPRWQKDGLFSKTNQWFRRPYKNDEQMNEIAEKIRAEAGDVAGS